MLETKHNDTLCIRIKQSEAKTCQQSEFQMKHTNTELEKAFLSAIILCG